MLPTQPAPIALLLVLCLPACRPHADDATVPPDAPAREQPAPAREAPQPEPAPASEPELEAAAPTEVIEIGVADVGAAATITAEPARPQMPSMMSDIRMGPSR